MSAGRHTNREFGLESQPRPASRAHPRTAQAQSGAIPAPNRLITNLVVCRGFGDQVEGSVYPIGGTLAKCDPFGTPSTSHWTGAATIVK
jgi:hypothetical protein